MKNDWEEVKYINIFSYKNLSQTNKIQMRIDNTDFISREIIQNQIQSLKIQYFLFNNYLAVILICGFKLWLLFELLCLFFS